MEPKIKEHPHICSKIVSVAWHEKACFDCRNLAFFSLREQKNTAKTLTDKLKRLAGASSRVLRCVGVLVVFSLRTFPEIECETVDTSHIQHTPYWRNGVSLLAVVTICDLAHVL